VYIRAAAERVGRAGRPAITCAAFATREVDGVLGRWSFAATATSTCVAARDSRFETASSSR
jgi:hypothetical protein